jgi:hypothetical protein
VDIVRGPLNALGDDAAALSAPLGGWNGASDLVVGSSETCRARAHPRESQKEAGMAKRSKQRRSAGPARKGGGDKVEGRGFVAVQHPFSQMDPDVLRARLLENARLQAGAFQGRLDRLLTLFRAASPPDVIATLSGLGLQVGMASDGSNSRELMTKIEQHHVEMLQALMLTMPISQWGVAPPPPASVQRAIDDIQALALGFQQQRFVAVEDAQDVQQKTVLALSEKMRMHTQMVRNWGYYADVGKISRELYGALDEPLGAHHGFSATQLVDTGQAMVALLEQRLNVCWTGLRKTMRGRTPQRIVRGFYAQFPDAPGDAETLIAAMPKGCTREQAASLVLTLYCERLPSLMTMSPSDLAGEVDLEEVVIAKILSALALSPGALKEQAPERFFMDNPIWAAPLVALAGTYFCPMPQAIFSKIHEIMRRLCEAAGIQTALQSRRAAFLEAKTEV